jgi:hypothetical protein
MNLVIAFIRIILRSVHFYNIRTYALEVPKT